MRRILTWLTAALMCWSATAVAATFEVVIHGMTCSFCVDGLERKLSKLDGVHQVDVSLKHRKVRIQTIADRFLDEGQIRQAVREAGFTPVEIKLIPDAE